jgi:hypothetical protein
VVYSKKRKKMTHSIKKYLFILSLFTILLQSSCSDAGCTDCGVPVEATVILTDVKGQILKNRQVSVSGWTLTRQAQLTDDKGRVQFSFFWNQYNESGPAIWAIQSLEDANWKMLNLMVSPTGGGYTSQKLTITDSIKMDSMATFKVRVKTARTDVTYLRLSAIHEGMKIGPKLNDPISGTESFQNPQTRTIGNRSDFLIRQKLEQVFLLHEKATNTPQLDTTFQMRVFANTAFTVNCYMEYKTTPQTQSSLKRTVTATASRDSVMLIQF